MCTIVLSFAFVRSRLIRFVFAMLVAVYVYATTWMLGEQGNDDDGDDNDNDNSNESNDEWVMVMAEDGKKREQMEIKRNISK